VSNREKAQVLRPDCSSPYYLPTYPLVTHVYMVPRIAAPALSRSPGDGGGGKEHALRAKSSRNFDHGSRSSGLSPTSPSAASTPRSPQLPAAEQGQGDGRKCLHSSASG